MITGLTHIKKREQRDTPVIVLTAYDWQTAEWLSDCSVDMILVGDSLGNVIAGHSSTLPVSIEQMIYHTEMVVRGAGGVPVIADMPFLSYEVNDDDALYNTGRMIKEAGATGVKIEGGMNFTSRIKKLVAAHIPVLGHTGLTPQSVLSMGGYKVQGRSEESAERIRQEAYALAEAGVFALVLECVPRTLAKEITESIDIPTIGIGAGPDCDGQVLVTHDLLGWTEKPKSFVQQYASFRTLAKDAVQSFIKDVGEGTFPDDVHSF